MKRPIQFGKYYLLERVNVGGMAEVFKAKAFGVEGFERLVAVKRILPNIAEDKEFITMFIDEAKISVQLQHANIAQIFDLGKVDDSYFIALEYVHGKDLRAVFDRGRKLAENMPIAQAAFVVMKICEGLDYAHNKKDAAGREIGLVHRDISPQNILISYEGEVKLIDFGIAKAAGKHSKTDAGILKGKFGYMSPEQVRGLPLDRRSDIFAVGIILYELLTGERLFMGESDFSTLEKVRNVEILPPSTYNRQIPDELERIVLRALAKDVDERYQHSIDLHDDLQAFLYSAGLFYSRKDLAGWMKKTFGQEIEKETRKLEEYQKLPTPDLRTGSERPGSERQTPERGTPQRDERAPRSVPPPLPNSVIAKAPVRSTARLGTPRVEKPRVEREVTPIVNLDPSEPIEPASSPHIDIGGAGRPASAPGPRSTLQGRPELALGAKPNSAAKLDRPSMGGPPSGGGLASAAPLDDWDDEESETAIYDKLPPALAGAAAAAGPPTVRPTTGPQAAAVQAASAVSASSPAANGPSARLTGRSQRVVATDLPPLTLGPSQGVDVSFDNIGTIDRHTAVVPPDDLMPRRSLLLYAVVGVLGTLAVGAGAMLWFSRSGAIALSTNPPDVQIIIGTKRVDTQGPTPVSVTNLEPGMHRVTIQRDGYLPSVQTVRVKAGQQTSLQVSLRPIGQTGFTLVSIPTNAKVELDGAAQEQPTPLKVSGLQPGPHTVKLTLGEAYHPWELKFELKGDEMRSLNAKLRAKRVELAISSSVPESVAFIEDKAGKRKLGPTPITVPITPGADENVSVIVEAPKGYKPFVKKLELGGETKMEVVAAMEAEAGPAPPPTIAPTAPPSTGPSVTPGSVPAPVPPVVATEPKSKKPTLPEKPKRVSKPVREPPVARVREPKEPKPEPERPAGNGQLAVNSRPAAKIVIDGKDTGLFTPQASIKLSVGKHRVTLINEELSIKKNFSVEITADSTTKLKAIPLQ